jgi:hypothetical protein
MYLYAFIGKSVHHFPALIEELFKINFFRKLNRSIFAVFLELKNKAIVEQQTQKDWF